METIAQSVCLLAAGSAIAALCICLVFGRIAAAQKSAIGCFVLGVIFFCVLAGLFLWMGLSW